MFEISGWGFKPWKLFISRGEMPFAYINCGYRQNGHPWIALKIADPRLAYHHSQHLSRYKVVGSFELHALTFNNLEQGYKRRRTDWEVSILMYRNFSRGEHVFTTSIDRNNCKSDLNRPRARGYECMLDHLRVSRFVIQSHQNATRYPGRQLQEVEEWYRRIPYFAFEDCYSLWVQSFKGIVDKWYIHPHDL